MVASIACHYELRFVSFHGVVLLLQKVRIIIRCVALHCVRAFRYVTVRGRRCIRCHFHSIDHRHRHHHHGQYCPCLVDRM